MNCTSNFADVASILVLLRFDEYQIWYISQHIIKLWQNPDLCCAFIDVYHIYSILMTYMHSFYHLFILINEILAICCVCFWCLCYPDSRGFSFVLSLTAESGDSDSTLGVFSSKVWKSWKHASEPLKKIRTLYIFVTVFDRYECIFNRAKDYKLSRLIFCKIFVSEYVIFGKIAVFDAHIDYG